MIVKHIVGYVRISSDDDPRASVNNSIENQKDIITGFVEKNFPDASLTFFEDRDISGYTFTERPGYQQLRRLAIGKKIDILIIKDFSRFSRRNALGLVELEFLRDQGLRIISINDNVDFPSEDDWFKIQLQFLVNELPVVDSSKKVKAVIKNKQQAGEWLCAAPYGYVLQGNRQKRTIAVVPEESAIVQKIYDLYLNGWGYRKIADYLTSENIPTPTMSQRIRNEAEGKVYKRKTSKIWSVQSLHGILSNDFYCGILRQGKFTRKVINGKQIKQDEAEQIIFEDHHPAIIERGIFDAVQESRKERDRTYYNGIRKFENAYSGVLFCGDCGSPMFSRASNLNCVPSYVCGSYHRRGKKLGGCTSSHHTPIAMLDDAVKHVVRRAKDNSLSTADLVNRALNKDQEDLINAEVGIQSLKRLISDAEEELKQSVRQRTRTIMKSPDKEDDINDLYDELDAETEARIQGYKNQVKSMMHDQENKKKAHYSVRTAIELFDDIINKEYLERKDISLLIEKIIVTENDITIQLKPELNAILSLNCSLSKEDIKNFKSGTKDILTFSLVCKSEHRTDKVFSANTVIQGSPSRILRVRRISLGMTTLPRSSMRRTIPVAFIYPYLRWHICVTEVVLAFLVR